MWMQGKEPGAGSGFQVKVNDFGNGLGISFVDETGKFWTFALSKNSSPLLVANRLRWLANAIALSWEEAEHLRQKGTPIEYRDGGAQHRELAWRAVDGPITEHMADFDFRTATV